MIDIEKYQPAQQNMKLVTRTLRSLATKLHILARQADIFGINFLHPDNIYRTYFDLEKHVLTSGKHSFISAIDGISRVLPQLHSQKFQQISLKFHKIS